MTARQERAAAEPGCDEMGANFMDELKSQLASDEQVRQRADRRMREDPSYDGDRRRASDAAAEPVIAKAERHIGRAAGIWGGIAVVGGGLGLGAFFSNPFEMAAAAQEAHAAINKRIDDNGARLGKIEGRLDGIDRNQTRALALQLRQERRALQEEVKAAPPGRGRDLLQLQLDRVEEDIKELGSE